MCNGFVIKASPAFPLFLAVLVRPMSRFYLFLWTFCIRPSCGAPLWCAFNLTDKCYICLLFALSAILGSMPLLKVQCFSMSQCLWVRPFPLFRAHRGGWMGLCCLPSTFCWIPLGRGELGSVPGLCCCYE